MERKRRLGYIVRRRRRRIRKAVKYTVIGIFVLAVTVFNNIVPIRSLMPALAVAKQREDELRIWFLDVGQGDCSVVSFPDGSALVIDAGDGTWLNENALLRFFNGLKPTELTFVMTHADLDHGGGIAKLIEYYGAKALYLPPIGSDSAFFTDAVSMAEKKGAELKTEKRYEVIDCGEAYAVFLSPYSAGETDENESSAVLYLAYGETTALFTADITAARETKLLQEYEIMPGIFDVGGYSVRLDDVDILKVAHHGSNASSSAEWLDLIKPEVSVISCGRDNPYGHPKRGALERLADCGSEIYRTDELGNICISAFSDGRFEVSED